MFRYKFYLEFSSDCYAQNLLGVGVGNRIGSRETELEGYWNNTSER